MRWIVALGMCLLAATAPRISLAQATPESAATPAPVPATGALLGQNDPCTSIGAIVSRPSQTTSVCTVRPNHVLIETGYQNTSSSEATLVQYPQASVRIGTAVPALEFDVQLPQYERSRDANGRTSGSTDIGAGLKYVFGYTPRFNYGVNVFVTAPTGANGFSAGGTTFTENLNLGYTINRVLSVASTLGFNSLDNGSHHYASFIPSLVLTAGLPNATGLFVEAADFTHANGPGTSTRTQLLGGVTRGLSERLQVDLEYGGSPTVATGKYRFIGLGASYYL